MTGIISGNVGRTSGLIKAASGGGGGVWTLIKTLTSDGSDSDLSFVNGTDDVTLDSTYPIYKFVWTNIHPETDDVDFQVGFRDGGSAYDATKTSTFHQAYNNESGTDNALTYQSADDLAQSTSYQNLNDRLGNDNDQNSSGYLFLFGPSSTTHVHHFIAETNRSHAIDYTNHQFIAGYCNVAGSAIDGVQFKMSSGEIQGGKIKLYGLGDS